MLIHNVHRSLLSNHNQTLQEQTHTGLYMNSLHVNTSAPHHPNPPRADSYKCPVLLFILGRCIHSFNTKQMGLKINPYLAFHHGQFISLGD